MPSRPDVLAAGAVVLRKTGHGSGSGGGEVLLVHRPKYDDWSFPKGKLDRGEHATAAAVREVEEETGLAIRLGRPLSDQRYPVTASRAKTVHYWVGRVTGPDDISGYAPNAEIDEVAWVTVAKAARLLTYDHDRVTLEEALEEPRATRTLVVLRHAAARSRSRWRADDRFRPLLARGTAQAERLVPLIAAYGVTRLVTSSSTRCVATVTPYADATGRRVESDDRLSEEDATAGGIAEVAADLLAQGKRTLVCTHRPVLPQLWEALGFEDRKLEPAELVVLHHRKGRVVSLEVHRVR
ncbi:NUDIX hydrolase [Nocardioides guangzhouensis]|uniref:NUDIX hydrolase n=1 Tax=Nocardioides guangzhouensis TaxID=2497878 RepID=A0A4Q4ZB91_9ACTN|nr:NUDIX hydrolase [Nocardioides guangzhouensis]RYP85183.1 NUDIX hydrolase [Nocardioides guangzhouensis]